MAVSGSVQIFDNILTDGTVANIWVSNSSGYQLTIGAGGFNTDAYIGVSTSSQIFDKGIFITNYSDYPDVLNKYIFLDSGTICNPHTYADTVVSPTCADKGYTEHTCSRCGDSNQDTPTSATGIHGYKLVCGWDTDNQLTSVKLVCQSCGDEQVLPLSSATVTDGTDANGNPTKTVEVIDNGTQYTESFTFPSVTPNDPNGEGEGTGCNSKFNWIFYVMIAVIALDVIFFGWLMGVIGRRRAEKEDEYDGAEYDEEEEVFTD